MMRRFFPSTIRGGVQFPFLVNNSFDSFGFIKLYDTVEINGFNLIRALDNTTKKIPWQNNHLNKGEILNFGNTDGTDGANNIYAQKNTEADLILTFLQAPPKFVMPNIYDAYTNATANAGHFSMTGTLRDSLIRNRPFLAFTFLIKMKDNLTRRIFTIMSSIGTTNPWCLMQAIPNGFQATGRRLNADSYQSAISPATFNLLEYNIVTSIFDFTNRELIVRINGVEQAKITDFGSGGNSQDLNPTAIIFLGGTLANAQGCPCEFAHATFWNSSVNISEIQEVENFYSDIKDLLP